MFEDDRSKVIRKLERLSEKYHRLSLLVYELSQSIKHSTKSKSGKEFKKYMKDQLLDVEKIKKLSMTMNEIQLDDLRKEKNGT